MNALKLELIIDPRTGRQAQVIPLPAAEYSQWEAVRGMDRRRVTHAMLLGALTLLLAIVVGITVAGIRYFADANMLMALANGLFAGIVSFALAYMWGKNVVRRWSAESLEEKNAILKPYGIDYEFLKVALSREHFFACDLARFKYVVAPAH